MYTGTYRIAERIIAIESLYPDVHAYWDAYRWEGEPELTLCTTPADIALEREKSASEDRRLGVAPRAFPDAYLEELALYRQLAERMPAYDTMLMHGSAVAVDGEAYLFTAKSGTGKSTHTRLWRELLGSRAVMVNDDKPMLRLTDTGVLVCGTPYNGKHRLGENLSVPLKAVCILSRGAENTICPITAREGYPVLLQQVYRPANARALEQTLGVVDRLLGQVKLYRLSCTPELQAAQVAYNGMKG